MSLPDWKLIHVIPMDELMKEQHLFARIFFICNLLVILFFALLSCWNARAISGPILDLSEVMKNVVKEAYAPVEVPGTSEEIQILYRGYNTFAEQTQQLLQTIYEEEREKNDYQFRLIQEQIKPHFLYNTLEMIKSMIDLGIYDEAGEAISTLARFYRHSLSKGSNIITIATEIDMVKQYLYIEKLRHMEYFDYEIVCEKETEQYVIPKLTLQPILIQLTEFFRFNSVSIILYGYDKFEYAQKAIQMGVQDFLLKPVTVESLHKSLRQTSERIDQEVKKDQNLEVLDKKKRNYQNYMRHFAASQFVRKDKDQEGMQKLASEVGYRLDAKRHVAILYRVNHLPGNWKKTDYELYYYGRKCVL